MSVASPPPRARGPSDADLDLSALGSTLWRKKWTVLRPTILVAVATFLVVQVITPRYQSEARIFIESRDNIYLRPDVDKDIAQNPVDDEAVTSQVQIILSRDLAREVIKKLKLNEKPEFDPALNGVSPIKAVLGLIGVGKDPLNMTPEERVLNSYYDRLTVTPVDKSRVINIDFLSQDPELAAQVANAIADGYLMRQREAKEEQAKTAAQWLSGEIETMRQKVEQAEAKVEAFRAKSNLLVGNNNTTLSAQTLGDVNAQLAAARSQKADAEAKAKMIHDMLRSGQPIESSDILNSELIRRLAEQRVTLRAQLAEQSATLLDNHPRIIELKAQIADLNNQIRAEAEIIARSFENDAQLAGARVDTLTASLDQLKSQAATTNGDDVQLRALERDAKSQRDLLESYLAKYREATSRNSLDSTPADARVISRATVSNVPAYPKKLPTVLIATFATLLTQLRPGHDQGNSRCPGRSRTGAHRTERRNVRRPGAAIGGVANEPPRPPAAAGVPTGSIVSVADNLRHAGTAGERLAVFGAVPGINTSQTAIKLARLLADDSRVVLVGLASGDTAIRGISNEPSAPGLAELACGAATFGNIITKDKFSPLHLIAAGHGPVDRVGVLAAPGVVTSFNALARAYDHLVVDAGEAAGAEIERISEIAPNAVLITDMPSSAATTSARDRLRASGFGDVRILVGGYGTPGETAAAA